jgi:hypothetical protein
MEGHKIIQAVTDLFKGADERDWQKVRNVMADNVLLDYQSMTGIEPGMQTPVQITDAWESFLPGFDKTDHQLSEFRVKIHGNEADVDYIGKADHFIGEEVWTISGNYQTRLVKQNDTWLITYLRLNYDKQSGNTALPQQAKARLSKLQS